MEQSYSKKPHLEGDQLLNSVTKSGHIGGGSYMYEQLEGLLSGYRLYMQKSCLPKPPWGFDETPKAELAPYV